MKMTTELQHKNHIYISLRRTPHTPSREYRSGTQMFAGTAQHCLLARVAMMWQVSEEHMTSIFGVQDTQDGGSRLKKKSIPVTGRGDPQG
jgi:hypothetical protein